MYVLNGLDADVLCVNASLKYFFVFLVSFIVFELALGSVHTLFIAIYISFALHLNSVLCAIVVSLASCMCAMMSCS